MTVRLETGKTPRLGFVAVNRKSIVVAPAGMGDVLGSGLIDHNQKMTTAAIAIADMKVCAQRS